MTLRRGVGVASGGVLGLFAARIIAELSGIGWRMAWLLPMALALAVGGAFLVSSRRCTLARWPLWLLAPYLLWPQPSLGAAGLLALACLVALLYEAGTLRTYRPWVAWAAAGASLILYLATLDGGVQPADSGEFQVVAATLGIAHPPGYPLYTMLGRLFTLIPLASPATMTSLMSALAAAGTVGLVAATVGRAARSGWAALLSGLALAAIPTFWAQSVTTNIRSLTCLGCAGSLYALRRWQEQPTRSRLAVAAAVFGLGVTHHASLALLAPAALLFVLWVEPAIWRQPHRWLLAIAAVATPLLLFAYLPLRSLGQPAFAPSLVRTWKELLDHVLARGFGGDMLYYRTLPELAVRGAVWLQIVRLELGPILPWATLAAALVAAWCKPRLAVLCALIWLLNTLSALTYRAPQTVEYLMPSYVALAMLLGLGLGSANSRWRRWGGAGLAVVIVGVALMAGETAPGILARRDGPTASHVSAILESAPQGATVLCGWHDATPLWYAQHVEKQRPDLDVRYVYPQGATPNADVWLSRIRQALGHGPVVVTSYYYAFDDSDLIFEPLRFGWLVHETPLALLPEGYAFKEIAFANGVSLAGVSDLDQIGQPGQALTIDLAWRADRAGSKDAVAFCQLVGSNGVVAGVDQALDLGRLGAGEIAMTRCELTPLLHTEPGEYQVIAGLYQRGTGGVSPIRTNGSDYAVLGRLTIAPLSSLPASGNPKSLRFEGGARIVGLDVDRSLPGQTRLYVQLARRIASTTERTTVQAVSGGALVAESRAQFASSRFALVALDLPPVEDVEIRLFDVNDAPLSALGAWGRRSAAWNIGALARLGDAYVPLGGEMALVGLQASSDGDTVHIVPQLLALRTLHTDYTLSVGLRGQSEAKVDGTPAMGAIPTLKWLRGWLVTDSRNISVDNAADSQVVLSVYDAFTLRALPVLDERRVRAGQGVELLFGAPVTR